MQVMKISLNGKPCEIDDQRSVLDLLHAHGYANKRVAVEINQQIVPRSEHASRLLSEDDRVEIVHAIGGG